MPDFVGGSLYGRTFVLAELADATGWSLTTIHTYLAKKWQRFLHHEVQGLYRVVALDFSEQEVLARQSQVAPEYDCDETLSFAGEDCDYLQQVVASLYALVIRVCYVPCE